MGEDALIVEILKQRMLQRLFGTDSFCGSDRERCDTAMATKRSVNGNGVESVCYWFIKALLLLKLFISSNITSP